MKKWNNKYWNVIVVILFLLVCVYAHFSSDKYVSHIEKHGVWTICETGRVGYAPRGGKSAPIYYTYRGKQFRDGMHLGNSPKVGETGYRFFIVLMPEKPTKITVFSKLPVPPWFTLEAPAEGWPTKPTEAELREMMVQDSLKRGLKRTLGIDTEIENNEEVEQ